MTTEHTPNVADIKAILNKYQEQPEVKKDILKALDLFHAQIEELLTVHLLRAKRRSKAEGADHGE